jgi:hypothetical protein
MGLQALYCIDIQQQIQDLMQPEKPAEFWTLSSKIRIASVNLARKQLNLNLAERLLVEEILSSIGGLSESERHSEYEESIHDVLLKLQGSREKLNQVKYKASICGSSFTQSNNILCLIEGKECGACEPIFTISNKGNRSKLNMNLIDVSFMLNK